MKNKSARTLLLILGILLILSSVFLFATPGVNTLFMAYMICGIMLAYGITEIVFYFVRHREHMESGWVLADGIITVILSVMLLYFPGAQILTMSVLFAFWVLFTGVTRTSAAFAAKDLGISKWGWVLATGIIGILLGIWLLFDPLLAIMTIGLLIPLSLLMQGVSAVAIFFATRE